MAMKIDMDSCLACGACEDECPNGAVSSKGGNFTIKQALCTECSDRGEPSCVAVCPSDSIEYA